MYFMAKVRRKDSKDEGQTENRGARQTPCKFRSCMVHVVHLGEAYNDIPNEVWARKKANKGSVFNGVHPILFFRYGAKP